MFLDTISPISSHETPPKKKPAVRPRKIASPKEPVLGSFRQKAKTTEKKENAPKKRCRKRKNVDLDESDEVKILEGKIFGIENPDFYFMQKNEKNEKQGFFKISKNHFFTDVSATRTPIFTPAGSPDAKNFEVIDLASPKEQESGVDLDTDVEIIEKSAVSGKKNVKNEKKFL